MTQSHGSTKTLPFWFSLKLSAKPGTLSLAVVATIHPCPDSDINYSLHTLISCPWEEVLNTMFRDGHKTQAWWRRWLTKATWRSLSPSVNGTVLLPFLLLTTGLSQSYKDILFKVRLQSVNFSHFRTPSLLLAWIKKKKRWNDESHAQGFRKLSPNSQLGNVVLGWTT